MEVVKEPDNSREQALTLLMQRYEKDLLRMSCVYLRDVALAEDAVQETFLKAYRALSSFRGDSSEKTWLVRIAINTCKDMRRNAWFRFVDRRVTMDMLPEPCVPRAEQCMDVTAQVMALPKREMEMVLLYYYQGMTMAQAAGVLNLSEATASRRLKCAREKLRAVLERGLDDHE